MILEIELESTQTYQVWSVKHIIHKFVCISNTQGKYVSGVVITVKKCSGVYDYSWYMHSISKTQSFKKWSCTWSRVSLTRCPCWTRWNIHIRFLFIYFWYIIIPGETVYRDDIPFMSSVWVLMPAGTLLLFYIIIRHRETMNGVCRELLVCISWTQYIIYIYMDYAVL